MTGFVWLAGRPSLDLCNTRLGASELLRTPADLARWLDEAGLAEPEGRPVAERDLRAAVALRDSLRHALLCADARGVGGLAAGWLDGVPGYLSVDAESLRPRFRPEGCSCGCVLTPVVLDALDLARESPGQPDEAGHRAPEV